MATFYYDKVLRDTRLSLAQAKTYVQSGIDVEDKALALNNDYYEAVTYKSMLLKLMANKERDPAKQKQLLSQADQLAERSAQLREKQAGSAAAAGKKK
jgi:hypothetical protein